VDAALVRLALPHNGAMPAVASPGAAANSSGAPAAAARLEGPLSQRVDAFEREQILAELKRNNQRMTDTARSLGLERSHLYKKCQALGIDLRELRKTIES